MRAAARVSAWLFCAGTCGETRLTLLIQVPKTIVYCPVRRLYPTSFVVYV